jgi:putative ABC transport system substrate-binding protein
MLRRNFISVIGCATIAWPWIALARRSSGKVWRVAYLFLGALSPDRALFDAFRAVMRELGYIEGKNLVIDTREAEEKAERLPAPANEPIALGRTSLLLTRARPWLQPNTQPLPFPS